MLSHLHLRSVVFYYTPHHLVQSLAKIIYAVCTEAEMIQETDKMRTFMPERSPLPFTHELVTLRIFYLSQKDYKRGVGGVFNKLRRKGAAKLILIGGGSPRRQ